MLQKKNTSLQDKPISPRDLATSTKLLPFFWFSFETMVSAGWETMAQNTPAEIKKDFMASLLKCNIYKHFFFFNLEIKSNCDLKIYTEEINRKFLEFKVISLWPQVYSSRQMPQ